MKEFGGYCYYKKNRIIAVFQRPNLENDCEARNPQTKSNICELEGLGQPGESLWR